MKRLIAAAILLTFVLTVCITCSRIVQKCYDRISGMIEECELEFDKDSDSAARKAEEVEKEWADYDILLSAFINHGTVAEIGTSISRLESFARTKSRDNFYCECAVARKMLKEMLKEHKFNIKSVF